MVRFRWIYAPFMPILLLEVVFFLKTFINRFLNYIWVHLDRRFEISMKNYIFWYAQIIYSWFLLKTRPKIYENTSNPQIRFSKNLILTYIIQLIDGTVRTGLKNQYVQLIFWTYDAQPNAPINKENDFFQPQPIPETFGPQPTWDPRIQ